jgi:DNA-binding NtrC family response regulator
VSAERANIVLIVEDESLLREILNDFLAECGFTVCEATNADEAIEVLSAPDADIEVVFTDVRMPGRVDGFGLAKWVRENRPGLPVLITSGDVGQANVSREFSAASYFFPKPYNLDAVARHMRQTIALRKIA